jgi:predicted nuclease of predicted toxin-antitoxin system
MGRIRIYTNESVDIAIAVGLKKRGVNAFSARDAGNLGLTDEEQLNFAVDQRASVFTHDSDFLRIAARWTEEGRTHPGIIYCHQKHCAVGECIRRLKLLTTILSAEEMANHIEFI